MRAASSSGGGTARRNDRLAEEGARLSLLVLVEIDVGRDRGRRSQGAGVGRKMTGGGSGRVRSHGERIGQITTVAGFTKMGGGPCRRKKHHH